VSRRVTAFIVAALFAAVLLSFLLFMRRQAFDLRQDARVFEQLNALMYTLTATVDPDRQFDIMAEASGQLLGELQRLRIPLVITDTLGIPSSWAFLPDRLLEYEPGSAEQRAAIRAYTEKLDREHPHLYFGDAHLVVHYGEPSTLRRQSLIPWLQSFALVAVVGGGAWLFLTSFRSERERIWSAMARESAHQMGTPLSSLVGWLEVLETQERPEMPTPGEPDLVDEMASDVQRLQKVSRRFELIGRKPQLEPVSVRDTLEHLRRYFTVRLPSLSDDAAINIEVDIDSEAPAVLGNLTLLEWAFENLIKNSIDAMAATGGRISIAYLGPNGRRLGFRVRDTGPGVPTRVRDKIFDIGVTTKESGWGVGLSLTRRIIEDMHGGSIQLEEMDGGASFRVELPRVRNGA